MPPPESDPPTEYVKLYPLFEPLAKTESIRSAEVAVVGVPGPRFDKADG
jgi:hypothetical protein